MSARITRPVRYLTDETATPPRGREVVTGTDTALAFLADQPVYDRPDHGDGSMVAGMWWVIPRGAPAGAEPEVMWYHRGESLPWSVGALRFAQMWEAMDTAADLSASMVHDHRETLAHP